MSTTKSSVNLFLKTSVAFFSHNSLSNRVIRLRDLKSMCRKFIIQDYFELIISL